MTGRSCFRIIMKSESGYSKKNGIRSGNIQDSQNFKIPGSPSGRYYSDFGSPKINLTSPNKKDHKCQSKTFSIHKYQRISRKEFYCTIYRVSAEFLKINLRQL